MNIQIADLPEASFAGPAVSHDYATAPARPLKSRNPRMKHDTRGTQKFRKLHRLLGRPYWEVVGILESIWLFTTVNAPLGDIGRFTNQEICDDIEFGSDPDVLIEALLDCGWLDEHDECRLCVHDWHDHAPRFIQLRAERTGNPLFSISGRQRRNCPTNAHIDDVVGITQPNPTQPNRTKPNINADADGQKPPKPKKKTPGVTDEQMKAFWDAWSTRKRVSKKEARIELSCALANGVPLSDIVEGAVRYALSTKDSEVEHIMHPHRWLKKERWMDAEPEAAQQKVRFGRWHCPKCRINRDTTSATCSQCGGDLVRGWRE